MTVCQRFDDFLDDELSPAERSEFVNHLPECSDCSRELEAQRRFERMISTVRLASQLDAEAIDSAESDLRSRIRRVRLANAAKAVAAMLLLGLGAWSIYVRSDGDSAVNDRVATATDDAPSSEEASDGLPDEPEVTVEVADDSPYVPVTIENGNPEITIIWFHPTIGSRESEPSSNLNLDPIEAIARRS